MTTLRATRTSSRNRKFGAVADTSSAKAPLQRDQITGVDSALDAVAVARATVAGAARFNAPAEYCPVTEPGAAEGSAPFARIKGFLPLRGYAVIGDGRSCALVGVDGAVDWWALPVMDAAPTFGALLDQTVVIGSFCVRSNGSR